MSLFAISACQNKPPTILSSTEITQQDVLELNIQACQRLDKRAVIVKRNHPLQKRLDKLGRKLPKIINGTIVDLKVYLNTEPNAWSSLNGCIRVNSGLLNILDDNEVLAVLAHEMGHIAHSHSLSTFQAAKTVELHQNGEIILITHQQIAYQQEIEADNYALLMLRRYRIPLTSLLSMLNKLPDNQINTLHPSNQQRIDNLQNKINQLENKQID